MKINVDNLKADYYKFCFVGETMKKSNAYSTVAGILFFALAALFSISLILVAVDFGGASPNHETFFYHTGKLLTGVYGYCSLCIPFFLLAAGLQCFSSKWRIRNGVVLIGSVLPFFTLDAVEHVCRFFAESEVDTVRLVKISSSLLVGAIILAIEYLLLSILGEAIESTILSRKKNADEERPYGEADEYGEYSDEVSDENSEETLFIDDDSDENFDEKFESDENESSDDVVIIEKDAEEMENSAKDDLDDSVYKNDDEDEYTEIEEPSSQTVLPPETEIVEAEKTEDDYGFDPKSDPLFLQQKEILKDLINDGAEENEEDDSDFQESEHLDLQESEAENSFSETVVDEKTFAPQETVEKETPSHKNESVSHEIVSQNKGYVLNEYEIENSGDEEPEDEAYFSQPVDSSHKDTDDFQNDFEEIENFNPAAVEKVIEPPAAEEDFEPPLPVNEFESSITAPIVSAANYEDECQIHQDETMENADLSGIEDIFNQMEADAAIEPVMKQRQNVADEISRELSSSRIEDTVVDEREDVDAPDIIKESEIIPQIEDEFEEPVFNPDAESEEFKEPEFTAEALPQENSSNIMSGYEFNPVAKPVVDADGNPYQDEEYNVEEGDENSLDDIDDFDGDMAFDENEEFDEDFEGEEVQENQGESASDKNEAVSGEKPVSVRRSRAYKIPSDLLDTYPNNDYWIIDEDTKKAGESLRQTLNEFGIEAEVTGIRKGPVVTMFEILPASGVKLNKIVSLQDNIALSLAASSVRIVAPIPGKHAVGIEIPNKVRSIVSFKEIIDADLPAFNKMAIPVILGKDISGEPQLLDLAKTPHLLIAGSTGAGKSVCVNSMLLSILYKRSPDQVKLVLIDPKIVELKLYNDIPHLLTPVITEPKRALQSLQYCLCEMERRYALLDGLGARDIISYNRRIEERRIATEKLPYIVVIIDEFADLMATTGKELESTIARLAAMSRAVGIHLVLATQRPSIDVITGLIKANIPSRIAFMVASKMDSRIIIDQVGAEKLLGKGDMLYSGITSPFPTRIQGTLVSDNEVENVVEYVKSYGEPEYIDDEIFVDDEDEDVGGPGLFSDGDDPLYDQALQIVVQAGKASASYIQRRLKIGYNRAARLVEEMEERGIVGPQNGSKPREIIHLP